MTRLAGSKLPTLLPLALFAALGCGGSAKTAETPAATEPPAEAENPPAEEQQSEAPAEQPPAEPPRAEQPPPANLEAQLIHAKKIWGESCANCHGPKGEGGKNKKVPPVVGGKALGKFKTGGDLYEYVKTKMPKDDPGSLTETEFLAVTAWIIIYTGRLGEINDPVTTDSVKSIKLH